jgi:hypothetical protein
MMKAIRCGRGLGDSIYLQSVVRHLVEKGHRLIVRSDFPDVFRPLGDRVKVTPFSRAVQISAHYAPRKRYTETTQFQDCCIGAGILYPIDLRLDWTVTDPALVDALSEKKPILCVQMPRAPMGRTDGFGMELLPDCRVIQRAIDSLKGRATIVQIGSGKPLFHFTGIDIDLANKTSIAQLLDVASISDGFLGYCSFILPLAESFSKPALIVWAAKGLKAGHPYIRQITPSKVIQKASTVAVLDDAPAEQQQEAFDAFMR